MTEEIIIDGVNVAECEYALTPKKQCPAKPMYYAKETSCIACKEHNTKLNFCKNNPNCYYKQLKRLEQELKWANDEEKYLKECCIKAGKELEKHSFKWDGKEKNLVVQALQLNQLYERLEQENNVYKQSEQEATEIIAELKEYSQRMENQRENYYKEYNKYRSALEEIREIAMGIMDDDIDEGSAYYDADQIINKINEVLND